MPRISYRNKILLKKLLRIGLFVLALALLMCIVVLIYVEPYMVYDRDGAHLDLRADLTATEPPIDTAPRPTVDRPQIVSSEGEVKAQTLAELGGYYITTSMLRNPQAVLDAVMALDSPCAVMIQLKSIWGNFYYSTSIGGAPSADVEIELIDELIAYLKANGFYMIAEIPAFSDTAFALENIPCGLPLSSGALWMDENGCYWLDPANENVLSYLMQIVRDLTSLGFNEVAFSNFTFPTSSSIVYNSAQTGTQLISEAASQLTGFFSGSELTISFVTDSTDFPAEGCTGRLFFPDVDGSRVERYLQAYTQSSLAELVFLATSRDTRFEEQAVLRPLIT